MRSFMAWLAAPACLIFAPAPADAEWKEARSRNFIVYSQGSQASLVETAAKLEKFDFMLRAVSNSKGQGSPVPLKVYLMSSREALQATMGLGGSGGVAGYYSASSRGPIAVGTRSQADRTAPGYTRASRAVTTDISGEAVLLHEYAHHFMFQHFPAAYPSWYSEGFAEYYSTTRLLENDVIEIGHVAPHRYISFSANEWLPLEKLLTATDYSDVGQDLHLLYAEGWLLVHYLGNAPNRRGQLTRYLNLLNGGASYREAMDQAFGPGARALNSELHEYSRKGRLTAVRLPFKPIDVGRIDVRSLSPAEDALVESEIALGRGIFATEAGSFAASVRRIAERFPRDAHALGVLAEAERLAGNHEAAAAAVSAWLSVTPNSARARLMRAQLAIDALSNARSPDSAAWESARAQILAANKAAPNDPLVLEAYYDSFVAQGLEPPASAQNALFRAFELVPQDEDIRFKLASDFEARGMIGEAITIIKPAAAQAHDPSGDSESEREKRRRREEKYREVGDRLDAETPREMLKRLEAKAAATK